MNHDSGWQDNIKTHSACFHNNFPLRGRKSNTIQMCRISIPYMTFALPLTAHQYTYVYVHTHSGLWLFENNSFYHVGISYYLCVVGFWPLQLGFDWNFDTQFDIPFEKLEKELIRVKNSGIDWHPSWSGARLEKCYQLTFQQYSCSHLVCNPGNPGPISIDFKVGI